MDNPARAGSAGRRVNTAPQPLWWPSSCATWSYRDPARRRAAAGTDGGRLGGSGPARDEPKGTGITCDT